MAMAMKEDYMQRTEKGRDEREKDGMVRKNGLPSQERPKRRDSVCMIFISNAM